MKPAEKSTPGTMLETYRQPPPVAFGRPLEANGMFEKPSTSFHTDGVVRGFNRGAPPFSRPFRPFLKLQGSSVDRNTAAEMQTLK